MLSSGTVLPTNSRNQRRQRGVKNWLFLILFSAELCEIEVDPWHSLVCCCLLLPQMWLVRCSRRSATLASAAIWRGSCKARGNLDSYSGLSIAVQRGIRCASRGSECGVFRLFNLSGRHWIQLQHAMFFGVSFAGLAATKNNLHCESCQVSTILFGYPTEVLRKVHIATRVHHGPQ